MNYNQSILVFLLLFISFTSNCQSENISGSKLTQSEIQHRAGKSLELWNHYLRNDLDSLKLDAQQILFIGIEGDNEFAINVGKRSLGSYLIRTGQALKGIYFLKAANNYFGKKENFVLQTEILNEIGNGYFNAGKPIEAEKYYLKSLRCGKKSPDPTSSFLAEVNLANVYISLRNYEKANAILHHYKKESLKHKKLESVSSAYALLGTIEQAKNNIELALEYFRKSADYGFKSNSTAQIAHAYNNMAIVYFIEGETKESLDFFNKALVLRLKTKNAKSISESYFNLGDYFTGIKDYDQAWVNYTRCDSICIEKNLLKDRIDVVYAMMLLEKEKRNYEKALTILESYAELRDDYFSELSKSQSADLDLIETIENMEHDQVKKIQEAKLVSVIDDQNFHNKILYTAFGFSIVALIILAVYKQRIN